MPSKNPRVLVVGSGAIGGTITAHLLDAGVDVVPVVTNPRTKQALLQSGFRLQGHTALKHVDCPLLIDSVQQAEGEFEAVLLAVQPPQVEEAAAAAASRLSQDGALVCFQNGLCEERVERFVGRHRVIGGVVAWGASMPEPGLFDKTSSGGFTLGQIDGERSQRLEQVAELLTAVGPVDITSNLLGARWSKLGLNCAVSTLGTLGGQHLGGILVRTFVRRLGIEIVTETVRTAEASGVTLERVATAADIRRFALGTSSGRSSRAGLLLRHAMLLAVGARYRRLRSSMLQAIERGRPPAVDFLNGEVVSRAKRYGVEVPVNRRAQELVWEIARGERKPGLHTLRALYEETRSA